MSAPTTMRPWLHTVVFLLSLLGTAQLFAVFGRSGNYGPSGFFTQDGTLIPLAEIANFLTGGGMYEAASNEHPRGQCMPGLRVRQSYDRPRWDYFDAQGCILIQHNDLGFRDVEFPIAKPPGEFRVLAIGDSLTYGSGVLREDAWPEVLERHIAASGRPTQVINCGFAGGHAPAQYANWLDSDGLLLDPDLVVIGLSLNDLGNGNDVPMLCYQGVTSVGCPIALIDQFATVYVNWRATANPVDYVQVVRSHPETWTATQAGLKRMQARLQERSIPYVVAILPMFSGLENEPNPYAGLHRLASEFCREAGIPYVDLLDTVAGRRSEDLWVHPTDQHPIPEGHRLLAAGLYRYLVAQGLVAKAKSD
ncbi:MAG: hypothetical protein JNK49_11570 [Planctomycetes bacterium]|nr:hypothetical protein [Planctomycetota bacterium]